MCINSFNHTVFKSLFFIFVIFFCEDFVHSLVPHLCGTDNRLASRVAASNHHLLGDEDFLWWDLNTQVASGNHHTIALSQDLLKTDSVIKGRNVCEFGKKEKGAGMRKQRQTKFMLLVSVHYSRIHLSCNTCCSLLLIALGSTSYIMWMKSRCVCEQHKHKCN